MPNLSPIGPPAHCGKAGHQGSNARTGRPQGNGDPNGGRPAERAGLGRKQARQLVFEKQEYLLGYQFAHQLKLAVDHAGISDKAE